MTAYADLNEFVNRATGGNSGLPEPLWMHKEPRVLGASAQAAVAGKYTSLWQYEGTPSHGAVPTTVAVPTNSTQGAWGQANPGGGRQKWNTAVGVTSTGVGTYYLYDRLLHIGGLDGTVLTAQTVGGALTRYTGGAGNVIWAEIYTAVGTTVTTITASYTNQAGTSGHTTQAVSFGGTGLREPQRIIPLSLAAGDSGVQAVASVTLAASTTTAGNFGITIAHPLCAVTVNAVGAGSIRSFVDGPLSEIVSNACLAWVFLSNSATAPSLDAWMFNTER